MQCAKALRFEYTLLLTCHIDEEASCNAVLTMNCGPPTNLCFELTAAKASINKLAQIAAIKALLPSSPVRSCASCHGISYRDSCNQNIFSNGILSQQMLFCSFSVMFEMMLAQLQR